ncbi:hypothetical protein Pcinc_001613 [Petrolisthes cinctipes]|uniref:Uncharacterized protein n=1 Tax=Petrolisthes cinctipes TaxID=88211 RepID=A0AAE1GMI5_PETCI|nr:hypothetical protein Pcinc_001613 [Petrolisthes cinctipes]
MSVLLLDEDNNQRVLRIRALLLLCEDSKQWGMRVRWAGWSVVPGAAHSPGLPLIGALLMSRWRVRGLMEKRRVSLPSPHLTLVSPACSLTLHLVPRLNVSKTK